MKLFSTMIILIAFMLMLIGHTLYESGEIENIYNLTENTLSWNYNYTEQVMDNFTDMTSINIAQASRVSNMIGKLVDALGYSAMQISKYFIEFGYNNPQYDYNYGLMIIKLYFIFMLVSVSIPIMIPAALVIYLIFIGIKKLINIIRKNGK